MAETQKQRGTVGRVLHEFKQGELESSQGGKVRSRRQAIAIALSESGASNRQTASQNTRNARRSSRKEAQGRTAQQEREGKSKFGARGRRDGYTRAELYERARRRGVAGRANMTKDQLKDALGLG